MTATALAWYGLALALCLGDVMRLHCVLARRRSSATERKAH